MGSASRKKYGAQGGGDWMWLVPSDVTIAEEDADHPEHETHVERTRLDDPDMMALIESMREHGFGPFPVVVYLDGGRPTVAEGRRRTTAARIVAAEQHKARKPPFLVRAIITDDPIAARNLGNSCRKEDTAITTARRYVQARDTMGPSAAAACLGLNRARAEQISRLLTLAPELQARVARREVAIDDALRLGEKGSKAQRSAATSDKPREAVKEAAPRMRRRTLLEALLSDDALWSRGFVPARALLKWTLGDDDALAGTGELRAAALRAGWTP